MSKNAAILLSLLLILWGAGLMQAQETENPYADVPMSRTLQDSFVLGNPDAPVKIIEFSDFLCTSCQNYKPIIDHFIQEYVLTGQAQFSYRIFPAVDLELSVLSAGLVECTDFLSAGLFWHAHDLMFDIVSRQGFTEASITEFSNRLALDESALRECAARATQYRFDVAFATELGVRGTPSLFVQYGNREPVAIALPLPEQYDVIVNAIRPDPAPPASIEVGRYAGITTYRKPDGGFVLGEPDAPTTIVAFEDFLCPHCQSYQLTLQSFIDQYVRTGQAQFEYRFFPLIHPEYSTLTARIAECVGFQDIRKFWDAHDLLFEFASAGGLEGDIVSKIATLIGLDADALDSCLGRSMQSFIDVELGQQAQVSGTPAIRARGTEGQMEIIYAGQRALARGAVPLEVLGALAEGSPEVSIGPPEATLFNDSFLEDSSLIAGEPCGPPCWQNITPGETTLDEAKSIVEEMEALTLTQSDAYSFNFSYHNGDICCQITSQDGSLVSAILLQFSPTATVGDLIAAYGPPAFITSQPFTQAEAVLMLLYPEHQMILYAVVAGIEGKLEETSPIFSALYATDDLMANIAESTTWNDWQGYIRFSDYMDGGFDRQP